MLNVRFRSKKNFDICHKKMLLPLHIITCTYFFFALYYTVGAAVKIQPLLCKITMINYKCYWIMKNTSTVLFYNIFYFKGVTCDLHIYLEKNFQQMSSYATPSLTHMNPNKRVLPLLPLDIFLPICFVFSFILA